MFTLLLFLRFISFVIIFIFHSSLVTIFMSWFLGSILNLTHGHLLFISPNHSHRSKLTTGFLGVEDPSNQVMVGSRTHISTSSCIPTMGPQNPWVVGGFKHFFCCFLNFWDGSFTHGLHRSSNHPPVTNHFYQHPEPLYCSLLNFDQGVGPWYCLWCLGASAAVLWRRQRNGLEALSWSLCSCWSHRGLTTVGWLCH